MDPFLNEDVNIIRDFTIHESVQLQLRGDAFNIANRHIFTEPFSLGPNPNAPASSNFGYVNSTINHPRVIQVQMRLQF
jgi:hypothetical protein